MAARIASHPKTRPSLSMNWVTILWSLAAGASLTLGTMHLVIFLRHRSGAGAELAFVFASLGAAGIALVELAAMSATDPGDYSRAIRWIHVPIAVLSMALVAFVHLHFQNRRTWLAGAVIVTRILALVVNFSVSENLHFREITSLKSTRLLGQTISVIGEGIPHHWSRLGELSTLLLIVYVADASLTLWRRGPRQGRQKALIAGGGILFFLLLGLGHVLLIHLGVLRIPYLITFCFLATVLAIAVQLSLDASSVNQLTSQILERQNQISLAASAAQLAIWNWNVAKDRIWVTEEGRSLYGVPPEGTVTAARFLETVHPDDREAVARAMRASVTDLADYHETYRVVLPGGAIRWISARGRIEPAPDGTALRMRGVSLDITDRKLAEDRSRTLVEASPFAMITATPSLRIVDENARAAAVFGYPKAEFRRLTLDQLLPDREREELRAWHPEALSAPRGDPDAAWRELTGRRRDGKEFPIEMRLDPIETSEGVYLLASVRDITARKQAEGEARIQQDTLTHLARVHSLGLLAGSLAHEINQPLGIILANAQAGQLLLQRETPDRRELEAILTAIVAQDLRAAETIQHLRALLRRRESEFLPLDLNGVVTSVLKLVAGDLVEKAVTVHLDLADSLPELVGDEVQLQQVLVNLIVNACEAMAENPAGSKRLHLATRVRGDAIRLSVRDCGHGLPPEMEERIFRPFFTTKQDGLGIGLSICTTIVAAHHGRLWAESNPDGGASFHFELPIEIHPDE